MSKLTFYFFGPPRAIHGEQELEIGLSKGWALCAYLMLTAKPHSREALAALFWPESDESNARANLRRTLYRINKALGHGSLLSGETISRNPEANIWIDVEAFLQLTEQALPRKSEGKLAEALALYTDDFLAGFTLPDCPAFDEWQFFQREELRQVLPQLLVTLIEQHQQQSRWEEAISCARRWLILDPLHEPAHRTLMRLYALSGQQSAALRQYEQCRELLAEELGVEPAAETATLFDAIRTRQLAPTPSSAIAPAPFAQHQQGLWLENEMSRGSTLPTPLTSFVGRETELAEMMRLLQQPTARLVTVLGPGGTGKTRLALQTAHTVRDDFPDGVYWVDLQAVEEGDLLASAIGDTLTLSGRDDPQQQLLHYLQDKTALLVLDNFEQILSAADLLTQLLQAAPGIQLLVTSREALNLQEEWLYPLQGLPFPKENGAGDESPGEDSTYAAIRLLVERVRRVRPDFSEEDEYPDLVRICRLVEGMPLALELAASWAKVMDCATIAAEIEQNLAFLASNLRNVPARHRSMEAVFEHSWSLLTAAEQSVFRRLAVFRGGFRREAAQAVAGASLGVLTTLVDKSLLRWQASGRYQIHELLRQYADARLREAPDGDAAARQRHALYYTDFLYRQTGDIVGGQQREAADAIAADLENIRAAWDWAIRHRLLGPMRGALEPLAMFFHYKGRYLDAMRLYMAALPMVEEAQQNAAFAPEAHSVKALLLSEIGWIAIRLGHFEKAETAFVDCQNLYRELNLPPLPGFGTDPLLGLSTLASIRGDYPMAEELAQTALAHGKAQGHQSNHLNAAYQLAGTAFAQGRYDDARRYAETACALAEEAGDRWFLAYCLNELGRAVCSQGDYSTARRHFEASYAIRESMADPEGTALAMVNLGDLALQRQRPVQARQLYSRSIAIYRKIYDKGGLAAARHGLAKSAMIEGEYEVAQEQLREALQIASKITFTSLLLAVLATAGKLLVSTGRVKPGLQILALVRAHPATDHETRSAVHRQWAYYRKRFSPTHIAAAGAVHQDDLATVTQMALDELRAPLTSLPTPALTPTVTTTSTTDLVEPLTERELQVVQLVAQGLTNRQIAAELSVVLGTVKAHTNRIYGKLGVSNRVQAAARARELGLLG